MTCPDAALDELLDYLESNDWKFRTNGKKVQFNFPKDDPLKVVIELARNDKPRWLRRVMVRQLKRELQ